MKQKKGQTESSAAFEWFSTETTCNIYSWAEEKAIAAV